MPKHALNFKHLVGTASKQRGARKDEDRSVNAILERSRAATPLRPVSTDGRHVPPHLAAEQVSTWEGGDGTESPDSRVGVHPAELARREAVAQQRAARGVAGPAPPRSWRRPELSAPEQAVQQREPTQDDLVEAETFLGHAPSRRPGPPSLGDVCLGLTLRLLRDDTVVSDDDGDDEGERITMSEAVLAGVLELELHLRAALVSASALAPPADARLRDAHLRALLEFDTGEGMSEHSATDDDDEWEGPDEVRPTLAHLPLCVHPNPVPLLRSVPRLRALALTSLDLAFASVPALDRLVAALPPGLRALGLAGVRVKDAKSWERGLGLLASRMIVLQTLDMSYSPLGPEGIVDALFGSATPHSLPSLRLLGLRGGDDDAPTRKRLRGVVNQSRSRWVDVCSD